MILKFGGLVLLLAICGVFAEKKLQAFPTVDLASTLKHLPHLRHGLIRTHHSRARSLQASRFRSLLQSTDATCAWDVDREECSLSTSTMKSLLESSNTDFSALISQDLECLEKTSREDCNAEDVCLWEQGLNECDYADMRKNYEHSPCARAAPLFFDLMEAGTLCGKRNSRARCQRKRQCVWFVEDALCAPDYHYVYYGIDNVDDKASQVMDSTWASLTSEYEALPSSDNFTWRSYLDYEPSSTECPSDIEPLVCEYVDTYLHGLVGPHFYCREKYESAPHRCRADALCRWNRRSASCLVARSVSASVELATETVLTDLVPDGQDKLIVEAVFACSVISARESCNGTCVWNPRENECAVRSVHLASLYAGHANNSTDALCSFLNVDGASHCYDIFTRAKCYRREFCQWDTVFDCVPNEEFYLSAAADLDPSLETNYTRVKRQCSENPPPGECVVESDASSRITFSAWTFILVCSFIHYIVVLH